MAKLAMTIEAHKELEDFFRNMRQAFNSRDIKAYRGHFWTDKRFAHFDWSGRIDDGWGSYEEFLDQEFRYMEGLRLDLKDLRIHVADEGFAMAWGYWKMQQIDAEGREQESMGRVTFTLHRPASSDWKIVQQHYSSLPEDEMPG